MINKKAFISDINIINNKYILLYLEYDGEFVYKPGQYIIIIFNEKLRRSYSIASVENGKILIGVKLDQGEGTSALMKLKLKDNIEFIGPIGNFYYRESKKNPIFIATGIGITPINSMIDYLVSINALNLKLFWGVKSEIDFIFNFDYLKDKFIPIISDRNTQFKNKGYVTDYLFKYIDDFSEKDFYICGDPKKVNDIREYLQFKFQVEKDSIYIEKF